MKCINCGLVNHYIYKGNSLCEWCFELAKLLEFVEFNFPQNRFNTNKELWKETKKKIDKCRYWIKVQRKTTNFHYPEVIK